ncbi:MAG: Tfp pilus assembly protein FimT/FimU [Chthoniobacteraceae bacterium]
MNSIIPHRAPSATASRSGFSLIEMLTVMLIAGVLFGFSGPAINSLLRGNTMNASVADLAGLIEQARTYAVANNTSVWVSFQQVDDSLNVAVLASKCGGEQSPLDTYGTVPNSQIDLIGKPRVLTRLKLNDAGTFTSTEIPQLPSTDPMVIDSVNSPATNAAGFFTVNVRGAAIPFKRTIQFTPSGEARTTESPINLIEFAVQPCQGSVVDNHNVAVVRISGLTGQTMVYRP